MNEPDEMDEDGRRFADDEPDDDAGRCDECDGCGYQIGEYLPCPRCCGTGQG